MDKSQGHEILKRLNKLITLIEEQNDILLFEMAEELTEGAKLCECDGTCEDERRPIKTS